MTKATNTQAELRYGATTAIADRDNPTVAELAAMAPLCPIDGTFQVGGVSIGEEDISTLCDVFDSFAPTNTSTDDITFDFFTEAEPDTTDAALVLGDSFLIAYTRRAIATPGTFAVGDPVTTLQVYVGGKVPQAMARTASDRLSVTMKPQDGAGYNHATVVA